MRGQRPGNGAGPQRQGQGRPPANGKSKPDKGGFDGENMGMTQERQREIQASLFKMLGQADDPTLDDKDDTAPPPAQPKPPAPKPKREVVSMGIPVNPPPSAPKREVVTAIPSDEAV